MNLRAKAVKKGVGHYEYVPADKLPPLWLMYCDAARADSNRVHAPVKQRWQDGDADIKAAVKQLAELADTGRCGRARVLHIERSSREQRKCVF